MMMPYSAYKDSKLDWLGKIPSHWDLVKLGACFKERNEKVSDKDFAALSVTKNGILPQMEHVAKTDAGDNRKKVCIGDFVINSRSDRKGSSGTSDYDGSVSLISIILEPRLYEPRFAHHLLRSYNFQEEFYKYGKGIVADLWSTRYSDMKNIFVPLMPIAEQKAIATFLDRETQRIDSLIEEKQTFIKLLKEKRQALISHVVTKGLNPNVEMQDSGIEWIGQVPKHWIVRRLKHTSTLQSGIAKGKDNAGKETLSIPMLRVANVQDGYVKLDDVHEINVLPHEVERYALKGGDVLMNEGGDNDKLGRGTVWKEQIKPCIHQNHVFVIRVTDIEPEWLGWLTQSSYAKFYFFRVSKQSTNLASISSTNVKEVHLLIPPADERKIIMEYLEKQTSKLKLLVQDVEESITLLKEHRTSLISAAVTGKIDVREAV
ncbi:type I restriction endonuclease subunit S [Vibrio parahaemolyticus]|uniref:Type I restriction endonuclease subunit S n=1 Tax=Shewanella marisflavi TaxID=260364 RepID=A0ABX5WND8_9GAMM|nr:MULTISPECIES: restriction endonuclease subunit S [Gammaproteobacteria]EFA1207033.1 type I restriction endonuclease subunit S [Escherichia coli]EJE4209929.1 restriction endonuclease subunit S [Vibrio parahaemolyticus]MBN8104582.1 restriction endonuclease subunit S [Vibrio vulnificus]QDF75989.1 type I restriction endonuclease subunit S [Shewanella marisflavi]TBT26074.1 type I restriction endonuclease subunit S [Vibrio parahaemolyticus]